MATTAYPVNHPAAVKHWAQELFKEALKETYAARFMARGAGALCQVRTELNKDKGDTIYTNLRVQLTGDGKTGDSILEGNEEALNTYRDTLIINQMRHAVRSDGVMSEQRVPWEFRAEAKDALRDWFADKIDQCGRPMKQFIGENLVNCLEA